jgi:hypothetical protein
MKQVVKEKESHKGFNKCDFSIKARAHDKKGNLIWKQA